MQAVVTVLDDASTALIELLWEGIAREFGITLGYPNPIPHFTWHVADSYDGMRLRDALFHTARDFAPFRAHAGGLGVFTGRKLVVHVPVVRNPALNAVQGALWRDLDGVGTNVVQHFDPELWIPHVTLAQRGLTAGILPDLLRWLAERPFSWEVCVGHLGVIADLGTPEVAHRFALTGPQRTQSTSSGY